MNELLSNRKVEANCWSFFNHYFTGCNLFSGLNVMLMKGDSSPGKEKRNESFDCWGDGSFRPPDCTTILEKGHRVVGLAHDEKGAQRIQKLGGEGVIGSIFDVDSIATSVGRADVVIHAATSIPTKVSNKPEDWVMNDRLRREGTRALTEAAAKLDAKTYVQQSVVWVGRPEDDSFFDEQTQIQKTDPLIT